MRGSSIALRFTPALLLVAGACATTGGTLRSGERLTSRQAETLQYWQRLQDSLTAQAIADDNGPRVRVRAEYASYADSRRIRAYFTTEDDAYVVVAHLDAAGRVRVLFPESPRDDGFVSGGKSYHTLEHFAGFESEYQWYRAYSPARTTFSPARYDSYDFGTGYVFIIASWRPMRLDRIASGDRFASFELMDENFYSPNYDPRPAIEELADILAGDNREAYTVQFAKYFTTNPFGGGYSSFASRSTCAGYSQYGYGPYGWMGFGWSSFGWNAIGWAPYSSFGLSPYTSYGCRGGQYYQMAYGWYGAQPPSTVTPRVPVDRPMPFGSPRIERPKPFTPLAMPIDQQTKTRIAAKDEVARPVVDDFRRRGLVTSDNDNPIDGRRQRMAPSGIDQRPSIVDMVGRRRDAFGELRRGSETEYGRPRNSREAIGRASDGPRAGGYSRPESRPGGGRDPFVSSSPRNGGERTRPRPSQIDRPQPARGFEGAGGSSTPRVSAPAPSAPRATPSPASAPAHVEPARGESKTGKPNDD